MSSNRSGYSISEIKKLSEQDEHDFKEHLEYIVRLSCLNENSLDITKKVIANGVGILNKSEENIFQEEVLNPCTQKECTECHEKISWCEMSANIPKEDYDGLCTSCRSSKKDDHR